jgi:putative flavoprotein involved in K+ transport
MGPDEPVVIAGGGAAGLAAAAELGRRNIASVVLERAGDVGASWAARYDSLRLNTPRLTSSLSRYRMPRRYGRWLTRDQMVEYLRDYARRLELEVRTGTEVERVDSDPAGWRVRTSAGELTSRHIVIAMGHDRRPLMPAWPGLETFRGELIHAASYREPTPFRGKDVLVVSAANTGSEIAYELSQSGASRVRTAMRRPPPVVTREWLGFPLSYSGVTLDPLPDAVGDVAARRTQRIIFGDLSDYGIGPSPVGMQTKVRREHKSPIVDAGFIGALKAGRIEIVAAVADLDGDDVVLADGERIQPEAVIVATGYSPDLDPVVGHLGVLDSLGYPDVAPGRDHPRAPGLFFNGYRASMTGQLCHMRTDARRIARAIAASPRALPRA